MIEKWTVDHVSKEKDQLTLWVVSGIVGVAVRDLYDLIFLVFAHAKNVIWIIAADIFSDPPQVYSFWGNILGLMADLIIGAMLGVVVGLTIKWTGPKNYLIKGLGVGLVAWLLFFGVLLHNLPHIKDTAPVGVLPNILAYIGHAIFGTVTAWVYMKLSKSETSNSWRR